MRDDIRFVRRVATEVAAMTVGSEYSVRRDELFTERDLEGEDDG